MYYDSIVENFGYMTHCHSQFKLLFACGRSCDPRRSMYSQVGASDDEQGCVDNNHGAKYKYGCSSSSDDDSEPRHNDDDAPQSVEPTTGAGRNWQKEFIALLRAPCGWDNATHLRKLEALLDEFSLACTVYGRVIIDELELEHKTISRSSTLGGVAGGLKYINQGILFKLPEDVVIAEPSTYLYGGRAGPNVALANKNAGREFAANNYLSSVLLEDGLSAVMTTPLTCLIDYRGRYYDEMTAVCDFDNCLDDSCVVHCFQSTRIHL
jgi:hypothetical protein